MSTQPALYVKYGDEDEINVSEVVTGLKFLGDDENPNPLSTYLTNAGLDGENPITTTYGKTIVTCKFWLHFGSWYDFKLAKREINKIFSRRGYMRLRTDSEPYIVKYVKPVPFELAPTEDGSHFSTFSIAFENPKGYRYSYVRSDELDDNTPTGWQLGMNLLSQEDMAYHFTSTDFKVYNASDIAVDPYGQKHDLKITIAFSGDSLTLTNATNGSKWTYNKPAIKSDSIVLDGIVTTLNGDPASANTDYGNIMLEPGYNSISVTGATDVDITFSFPFIYIG